LKPRLKNVSKNQSHDSQWSEHESPQCYQDISPLGWFSKESAYIRYPGFPDKAALPVAGCRHSLLNGSRDEGCDKTSTKLHLAAKEQNAVCNYHYVFLMEIFRFLRSK
jgi:hypothetical protein